jgi:hypothetical protein
MARGWVGPLHRKVEEEEEEEGGGGGGWVGQVTEMKTMIYLIDSDCLQTKKRCAKD